MLVKGATGRRRCNKSIRNMQTCYTYACDVDHKCALFITFMCNPDAYILFWDGTCAPPCYANSHVASGEIHLINRQYKWRNWSEAGFS